MFIMIIRNGGGGGLLPVLINDLQLHNNSIISMGICVYILYVYRGRCVS